MGGVRPDISEIFLGYFRDILGIFLGYYGGSFGPLLTDCLGLYIALYVLFGQEGMLRG
jgi:hypothetical protein